MLISVYIACVENMYLKQILGIFEQFFKCRFDWKNVNICKLYFKNWLLECLLNSSRELYLMYCESFKTLNKKSRSIIKQINYNFWVVNFTDSRTPVKRLNEIRSKPIQVFKGWLIDIQGRVNFIIQ